MEDKNFKYFMQQVKTLEKDHAGEFVVVYDQQIVKYFKNFDEACVYAENNYKNGTYIIQPCTYELNFVKSRRVTGIANG